MNQWLCTTLVGIGLSVSSQAALKVMAIGDSMTREYAIQLPFSAPDSNPAEANTMNWVEILASRRSADIDFGEYKDLGHEYNYGISGYDTDMWMDVIHANFWELEYLLRQDMQNVYKEVDVVVIMLGGNDIRAQYGKLYDPQPGDPTPTEFIDNITGNLSDIIDEIRDHDPTNDPVPIVLANVPDLGATPDKIAAHPDPVKRANATAIINNLNVAVAALATSKGVILAPISNLTDRIISPDPFYIGAIEMVKDADSENPPKYLFCKAGLHPSTNGQSVIANTLLAAINTATGSSIPLLPDREVVEHLLGLDPDQPYKDWATSEGLTDLSMTADKDGDGIPNLGEYLLDLDPCEANNMHIATVQDILSTPTLTLTYTPDTAAARLAEIGIKQSIDLSNWIDVPAANLFDMGSGQYQARMPLGGGLGFFRMEFRLKP